MRTDGRIDRHDEANRRFFLILGTHLRRIYDWTGHLAAQDVEGIDPWDFFPWPQ
jgi:hypothetical protein